MLHRQVVYKYHSWTHVEANWSADKNVKSQRSVPVILLILSQPPKRIGAAVSIVAVAAAEAYPTGLEGMVDVTAVSVRFTIGAPCNKATIRQDHPRQTSGFHRQINQPELTRLMEFITVSWQHNGEQIVQIIDRNWIFRFWWSILQILGDYRMHNMDVHQPRCSTPWQWS